VIGTSENVYYTQFKSWKTVNLLDFDFHEKDQDKIQGMFNRFIETYEGSSSSNDFINLKTMFIPPLEMNYTVIHYILDKHDLFNQQFTYHFSWGSNNYVAYVSFIDFIYGNGQSILSIHLDN
jgi:hypothetical protein